MGGVRIVCEDCLRNRLSASYVEIGRLGDCDLHGRAWGLGSGHPSP